MRVVAGMLVIVAGVSAAAQNPAGSAFQPGEISIGEPLALPFGGPTSPPPVNEPAAPRSADGLQSPAAAVGVPGSGSLGLSVAESSVPGRWRIDEVMPGGPAARAAIEPGDELRAVNGVPLAGAEEVSAIMTAIASGQPVRVLVARGDDLRELVLEAVPRPPAGQARSEPAAFAAAPVMTPSMAPAAAVAPVPPPLPRQIASAQEPPPTTVPPTNPWAPGASPTGMQPGYAVPRDAVPRDAVATAAALSASVPNTLPAQAPMRAAPVRDDRVRDVAATGSPTPASLSTGSVAAGGRIALGVRTLPIDAVTQSRFNLPEPAGAYVLGVVQDLPASRAGVPPGSVIVALDGRPVRSPGDLTQLVTSGPLDRPVTLQFILPGGESRRASVALQSLEAPVVEALAGPQAVGSIPALEPGPRRTERPVAGLPVGDAEATAIRQEVRLLRERLERLERRLQSVEPSVRR